MALDASYIEPRLRRLDEIVSGNRFNDFSPKEIFEIIFSFILNNESTTHMAKRLADRFGSMSSAMDAPIWAITDTLDGHRMVAEFFKLVPKLGSLYRIDKINGGLRFADMDDLAEYCVHRMSCDRRETVAVLMIDDKMSMLGMEIIARGTGCHAQIDPGALADVLFAYHAPNFILIHNHVGQMPAPSDQDIQMTSMLAGLFNILGKNMVEHLIVTSTAYTPIIHEMRRYGIDPLG